MNAPAPRIIALLACMVATSVAQQPESTTQTLDEVVVSAPKERERERGNRVNLQSGDSQTVEFHEAIEVHLRAAKAQPQIIFRNQSVARQLPASDNALSAINRPQRMQLLPDRLVAERVPWIREAEYLLPANIDEADGLPAHIPFGPGLALLNLDHISLGGSQGDTPIALTNAMHPQTRKCESQLWLADRWPQGTNPYVLLGDSLRNCNRAMKRREGDLLFAEDFPPRLRQEVQELADPIASRMANLLGSEPGNMFIAWRANAPHDGYRLQASWNRNSLLLFNGSGWQQGVDATQREGLRLSLMREQIQRRIRESDWPGPFTQSAVAYLLLLTRSAEDHTTVQRLKLELPAWMAGCASGMQQRKASGEPADVPSLECGLVLQFTYDTVARARSAGKQDLYGTWRRLLDASFRRGKSGATPADFIASSSDARGIAQGLMDGTMDWRRFAAALDGVGVKLKATSAAASSAFEVQSLQYFQQ